MTGFLPEGTAIPQKNIAELRNELKLAKEGKIDAKKAIDNYNDSLGKATGGVRSLGEMERKLNELAPAYLEMIQLKTKATIAYNKAAKEGVEADVEAANFGSYKTGMLAFFASILPSCIGDYCSVVHFILFLPVLDLQSFFLVQILSFFQSFVRLYKECRCGLNVLRQILSFFQSFVRLFLYLSILLFFRLALLLLC